MVSVRNRSRERSRNRSRKVKRSINRSRRVKRSINRSRRVKRSRRIINSKRTKRIKKKTPRKQRAYMKLFKGGDLKYEPSVLRMGDIPYTFSKKSNTGKFGVKFFRNEDGEEIIVKEIPKGREADHANDIIYRLGLKDGRHDFIVSVLDDGYVYKDNPSITGKYDDEAYMYAMEPCSGDLSYYVNNTIPFNKTIIDGFLDAFNKLHGLGYVHGDIKPENALLCNGVVKVGDIDTIYPNETVRTWLTTPLYKPFHMLQQHFDPPARPRDRAEYPETYHLLKQTMLNTTVDRWAMGICLYEFYVGGGFISSTAAYSELNLAKICIRVHNDLCHYHITGKLPDDKLRSKCFNNMDIPSKESRLNDNMKEDMLHTMKQYCLSEDVRDMLDRIKKKEEEERQPIQPKLDKLLKEINALRDNVSWTNHDINNNETLLKKLTGERTKLTDKRKKINEDYQSIYDQFSKSYDQTMEIYNKSGESSESEKKSLRKMEEKRDQIISYKDEYLSKIDSELAKKESKIEELEKLIKEYSKLKDDINNELKQKQKEYQKLEERALKKESEKPYRHGV